MISYFLYLIVILLGIPFGIYLSKICKEEIKNWRKRMVAMIIFCLIFAAGILVTNFEYKIPVFVGLTFIAVTFITVFYRSYNHKKPKKR